MEQKKDKSHSQNISNDLPSLHLSRIMTVGDSYFEKEHIELSSRGWNMKEAIQGFEYLLEKAIKKLDRK